MTVITRPDAFTNEQWHAARTRLEAQGFKILLGPDVSFDRVTSMLLSGNADAPFFGSLPENIAPSTDDNPFFFYTEKRGTIFPSVYLERYEASFNLIRLLVIVTLCACVYYIIIPFVRVANCMPLSSLTPPVTFFSAIGMGFMLIEISQMERLMLFLGDPVYGLGVVLFTILLFSGLGSTTVGAHAPRPIAVIVRVVALLTGARGGGDVDALSHHMGSIGNHRHAHSAVCAASGSAGVLHGG